MNLTQSAVEKHIIYLMHFFLALISPSIPPLTKSIFGEHAIIISIHSLDCDGSEWLLPQNRQACEKEKEKEKDFESERKN